LADSFYNNAINLYKDHFKNRGRELAKLYIQVGNYKSKTPNSRFSETPMQFYNLALKALQPSINLVDSLALPDISKVWAENTFFEIMDAKANYLLNHNSTNNSTRLNKILEFYAVSFQVEKKLLNNFVYDHAKINFLNESRLRTSNALDVCLKLYQNTHDNKWAEKALHFMESSKSIVLLEKLKQNDFYNKSLSQDKVVAEYKQVKKSIAEWENLLSNNDSSYAITFLDSALKNDETKAESLQQSLKNKYPQLN
jgi:hypothetical protein